MLVLRTAVLPWCNQPPLSGDFELSGRFGEPLLELGLFKHGMVFYICECFLRDPLAMWSVKTQLLIPPSA